MPCKALGALIDHSPEAPPSVLPSLGVSHCRVCSGCRPPCLGRVRPRRPGPRPGLAGKLSMSLCRQKESIQKNGFRVGKFDVQNRENASKSQDGSPGLGPLFGTWAASPRICADAAGIPRSRPPSCTEGFFNVGPPPTVEEEQGGLRAGAFGSNIFKQNLEISLLEYACQQLVPLPVLNYYYFV